MTKSKTFRLVGTVKIYLPNEEKVKDNLVISPLYVFIHCVLPIVYQLVLSISQCPQINLLLHPPSLLHHLLVLSQSAHPSIPVPRHFFHLQ